MKTYFTSLLIFGGVCLVIVVILAISIELGCIVVKEPYLSLLPAFGILLGGQIAGLAVFININNAKEQKEDDREEEKLRNNKILNAYYKHIQKLALEHKSFLEIVEQYILDNPKLTLEELVIDDFYYSNDINKAIYVEPLDDMLNHDLHKFTTNEIELILNIKEKILDLMHTSKVNRELHSKNDDSKKFLIFIKEMQLKTFEIEQLISNRLSKSH